MNIVDTDLMAYPESMDRDEQTAINKEKEYYEWCMKDKENIGKTLKNTGFFGSKIPVDYGGKDWTETELSILTEVAVENFPTAVKALDHNTVAEIISHHCSDEVKQKYLGGMAMGQIEATLAIFENETSPKGLFNTKASYDDETETWKINGRKSYILNGQDASVFVVVCDSEVRDSVGNFQTEQIVLLVDANAQGVEKLERNKTLGFEDSVQIDVNFKNVVVPVVNEVGKKGKGTEIAMKLLQARRMKEAVLGIHVMKKLMAHLTDYCINSKSQYISIS
jgi:alkylation response protein AidB-like acyl-CoA dehydrogenase